MNFDAQRPRWLPSARTTSRYVARPEYRERAVEPFPPELQTAVLERAQLADREPPEWLRTSPVAAGNVLCRDTRSALQHIPWAILDSDAALKQHAEKMSRRCGWSGDLDGMERICHGEGIEPPADKLTRMGRVLRMTCQIWWRRQLRRVWHARAEEAMRQFGLVHRGRAAYVTEWTRRRRRRMRRAMYDALKSATLNGENGETLELFNVWKGSIANPTVRRAELMVRLRGFETIAAEQGHVARFFTLTAPSAFHPVTTVNGSPQPNPRYTDKTADEARRWLLKQWARIRAKLKRARVVLYGFRIAEPHHDGTPHLHMLLWMPSADRIKVRRAIRAYMWRDYSDEPGMRRHRYNVKPIDPRKGSAVGYVAKYIAKNIDGHKVGEDFETGDDAHSGSRRAEAWATVHCIRQFQQIGGPTVGLWRECRRLRSADAAEPIERVRSAADAGDWAAFIRALGGIAAARTSLVSLWKEQTGELTRYGDVKPPQAAGILGPDSRTRTRLQTWRIRWGARSVASPWTRGNNCTAPDKGPGGSECRSSKRGRRKRRKSGPPHGSEPLKSGNGAPPGAG